MRCPRTIHRLRPGIVPVASEVMRVRVHRVRIWRTSGADGRAPRAAGVLPAAARPRRRSARVVDVDRQEAALIVMGVEQRELLMPVYDIAGVVDIEVTEPAPTRSVHPFIDQRARSGSHRAGAELLQPRQRRLRTQIPARVRQRPQASFKPDQPQARDRRRPRSRSNRKMRARNISQLCATARVAAIRTPGQTSANPTTLRHRQQHHAPIRSQTPAIEGAVTSGLTAGNERQIKSDMRRRAPREELMNQSYANQLHHARRLKHTLGIRGLKPKALQPDQQAP